MHATVFLAEKHSIAQALADVLPGHPVKKDGYIECGDTAVTWLSGHMIEQAPPEAYDSAYKRWTRESLPIIPQVFKSVERTDRGVPHQLSVIKRLLRECPNAVNAGDFDREGQLLVDEVLELADYRGRVLRLAAKSLDAPSLTRELGRMQEDSQFYGMRDAARARSQLDWLAGMNLTRAMTLFGRNAGATGVLSLGRVQTPTLALVVARDETIEHFEPKPFYKVACPFAAETGNFSTLLVTTADSEGCDEEGRLVDKALAEKICKAVSGQPGIVSHYETKRITEQPPLPPSLTDLQKEASALYGMSAGDTLAAAQALYEARCTSYPRTDCQYLPEEQFAEAPAVLATLAPQEKFAAMVNAADATRHSAAWNTKKVTAHHAIIPTSHPPRQLTAAQEKIYGLICRRYIWQFLPPHVFDRTRCDVSCTDHLWRAKGVVEVSAGWTAFKETSKKKKKAEEQLPPLKKGDHVIAGQASVTESKTEPPARFTEGTLVDAMENIQRYLQGVDKDTKAVFVRTEGLGTVATRAGIIQTLFERSYIRKEGKNIISTAVGRDLIRLCPSTIRDPLMTAEMEKSLSAIQDGKINFHDYVDSYAATLPAIINDIFAGDTGKGFAPDPSLLCPKCKSRMRRIKTQKGRYFWICSKKECGYMAADADGKPGRASRSKKTADQAAAVRTGSGTVCPECGETLAQVTIRHGQNAGKQVWICRNEQGHMSGKARFFEDDNGTPRINAAQTSAPSSRSRQAAKNTGNISLSGAILPEGGGQPPRTSIDLSFAGNVPMGGADMEKQDAIPTCPECGGELSQVTIHRGPRAGGTAWICRNDQGHATGKARFFDDDNGKPVLAAQTGQLPRQNAATTDAVCPECQGPLSQIMIHRGPNAGKPAWICRNDQAHATGKARFFDDDNGKPVLTAQAPVQGQASAATSAVCPECGGPLNQIMVHRGPNAGKPAWICRNEQAHSSGRARFFDDDNGSPVLTAHPATPQGQASATTSVVCPECGGPLNQIMVRRGPNAGKPAWICRNEQAHSSGRARFFDDDNGTPVLTPKSQGHAAPAGPADSFAGGFPPDDGWRTSPPDSPFASAGAAQPRQAMAVTDEVCPECGGPLRQIMVRRGPNAGNPAWICRNDQAHASGKARFFSDNNGSPVLEAPSRQWQTPGWNMPPQDFQSPAGQYICPECGGQLSRITIRKGPNAGNPAWICRNDQSHASGKARFFSDNNGFPVLEAPTRQWQTPGWNMPPQDFQSPAGQYICPECGGQLSRITIRKGPNAGNPAWICRNDQSHATGKARFFEDAAGAPLLDGIRGAYSAQAQQRISGNGFAAPDRQEDLGTPWPTAASMEQNFNTAPQSLFDVPRAGRQASASGQRRQTRPSPARVDDTPPAPWDEPPADDMFMPDYSSMPNDMPPWDQDDPGPQEDMMPPVDDNGWPPRR